MNDSDRWGKENPLRGAPYHEMARKFIRTFPVGTCLQPEAFDEWAQDEGYLKVPKSEAKQSDAWKAHVQRRHELKFNINKAGSRSNMKTPFVIESISQGVWEIRAPHTAIAQTRIGRRLETLMITRRRSLAYLMQSADFSSLEPHEQALAEALHDDISDYGENVERLGRQLDSKFERLRRKIEVAVETGKIKSSNGGIMRMIEGSTEEDE